MSTSIALPVRSTQEVLAALRISEVYRVLVGREPRRTGSQTWRGPAVWRGGGGFNLSMDDARGVWHDFTTGEGGGVLDLIVRIRGGSRQDALRWAADYVGRPLEDRRLSGFERACWARQQRQIESELPNARLWKRAALGLGEQVLDQLKAARIDRTPPRPDPGEIAYWTTQLATWRQLEGAALVAEYLWWARHHPGFTAGMIHVTNLLETAEQRALGSYLHNHRKGEA